METQEVKVPFLPDKINVKIEYTKSLIDQMSHIDERSIDKFWSITQSFVTYLQILWEYAHEIGAVAERTSLSNLAHLPSLLKEIEERIGKSKKNDTPVATIFFSVSGNKENQTKEKSFPIFELAHINKLQDCLKRHNKALRLLNETVLQQIVNAWERVLGDLVGWKLDNDSNIVPKDKSISYSQLFTFGSFDEVRRHIIRTEIIDFLKNKSTLEQIKYFKDEFEVDFGSQFDNIADLCEIVLRRHAIVHANGRATSEYCRRLKQLKKYSGIIPNEGTDLLPESDYIKRAWSVIYAAGVVITHLVARNHARQKKNKDDEDIADSMLINASFNSIKSEQYDAAIMILEYAHKLRLCDTPSDLMVAINLAQTYKWKGDNSKCLSILSKHNWNSASANFRLCVAALQDDFTALRKELSIVAKEKSLSAQELFEWPIFKAIVKEPNFINWVKKAYGDKAFVPTSTHKPKLIDFQTDKTISDILKSMVNNMTQKSIPIIESKNIESSINPQQSKTITHRKIDLTATIQKPRVKKKPANLKKD